MQSDISTFEDLFCQAYQKYKTLYEAVEGVCAEFLSQHPLPSRYKVCIVDIAKKMEVCGLKLESKNQEPHYHNRQHTKEVMVNISLFLKEAGQDSLSHNLNSSLWPKFSTKEKWILLMAALGHDYLHPGGYDQKKEFELLSSHAIYKLLEAYGIAQLEIDSVCELILATEISRVKEIHTKVREWSLTDPLPFMWRAKVILTESDICASVLPGRGSHLTQNLVDEWQKSGMQRAGELLTPFNRKKFLSEVYFTSPYAHQLGLNKMVKNQLQELM